MDKIDIINPIDNNMGKSLYDQILEFLSEKSKNGDNKYLKPHNFFFQIVKIITKIIVLKFGNSR